MFISSIGIKKIKMKSTYRFLSHLLIKNILNMFKFLKKKLEIFNLVSGNKTGNGHSKNCKCECHLKNKNSSENDKIIVHFLNDVLSKKNIFR